MARTRTIVLVSAGVAACLAWMLFVPVAPRGTSTATATGFARLDAAARGLARVGDALAGARRAVAASADVARTELAWRNRYGGASRAQLTGAAEALESRSAAELDRVADPLVKLVDQRLAGAGSSSTPQIFVRVQTADGRVVERTTDGGAARVVYAFTVGESLSARVRELDREAAWLRARLAEEADDVHITPSALPKLIGVPF